MIFVVTREPQRPLLIVNAWRSGEGRIAVSVAPSRQGAAHVQFLDCDSSVQVFDVARSAARGVANVIAIGGFAP